MIEGPTTGVKRQPFAYRRLTLTPFVVEGLPRGAGSVAVQKAIEKSGIVAKYAASTQGVKAAKREARAKMNDFDRFKLMVAKKTVRCRFFTICSHREKDKRELTFVLSLLIIATTNCWQRLR